MRNREIIVLIVCHNEADLLTAHFQPLEKYRVILLENASTERQPEVLPDNWELIQIPENRGVPYARNTYLQSNLHSDGAKGYFFVAPDIRLKANWDEFILQSIDIPNVAAIGCDRCCFRKDYKPLPNRAAYAPEFGDALQYVNKTALIKVGLYGERFFCHGQDIDWCRRARAMGFDLVVTLQDVMDFQTDQSIKSEWLINKCNRDNILLDEQYLVPWHNWKGDFGDFPPSLGGGLDVSWYREKWRENL